MQVREKLAPWLSRSAVVIAVLTVIVSGAACGRTRRYSKTEYLQRGKDFASQQKYAEAAIEFRNAVQLDAKYGEARLELAHAYLKMNDVSHALAETVRAADLMPDNLQANLEAAQVLLLGGKFPDAQARAELILEKDPNHIVAQLVRGAALAGLKDFGGAQADMDAAIAIDPQDSRPYVALGALQSGQGKAAEAEATFKHAVELAPKSVVAVTALANFYMAANRLPEAEELLKRAIQLEPNNSSAYSQLAGYYVAAGRLVDAEMPLKKVAELEPSAPSKMTLALYYVRMQRNPEAIVLLKAAAEQPGGFVPATIRLAAIDFLQNRRPDAYREIDSVLAKVPKNAEAMVTKGRFLMVENKLKEAMALAVAATTADPKSAAAFDLLGSVNGASNDFDAAFTAFTEAVRLDPTRLNAQIQLVRLQIRKGAPADALQMARDVVRQAPDDLAARSILATALAANGDAAGVQTTLTGLVKDYPNVAAFHEQLRAFLVDKGDTVGARREFDRSLELSPNSFAGLQGRIMVDLAEKKDAVARAEVEERVKKFPKDGTTLLLAAGTYPSEHYAFWHAEMPGVALPWGSFGENLTTEGLDEARVNIGDRLRIGSAEFIVTQPRRPCFKLGIRFGRDDIVPRFLASRRSGFYLKVAREGTLKAGDAVTVVARPADALSVAAIVDLHLSAHPDVDLLRRASRLPDLPREWQEEFRSRGETA